ncbi:MAG: baseplate J/gp47 family protein [Anaerolineae bacterium]
METINIQATDDRYTVREILRRVEADRVLLFLPWGVNQGWMEPLDFEVQRRVAQQRDLRTAWVIQDPARRAVARDTGLRVFRSAEAAERHLLGNGHPTKETSQPELERPKHPWWAPLPKRPKAPPREGPPAWLLAIEGVVLLVVLVVVAAAFLLAVPSAEIVLHPSSLTYSRIVPISVDPTLEQVDLQRSVVPSERVGEEFEGYAEVVTSGRGLAFSGTATGSVLFTNLLGQDYRVPEGTVVRTSAGSYPVRYETTADVTVPAFGQMEAPVQALVEGPRGNAAAYQINLIEGVVGFAVRVTNPEPISGAESSAVRVVSEADRARAWDLAAEQVLAKAYNGLQEVASQEPGRFLPQQTMVIQAAPKAAYTHLVGERTDELGLSLRLLITGQAVRAGDVQAIAYRQLVRQLPEGYTLTDARFEYGEAAEEDIGPGDFTFFVTAHGYASSKIDPAQVEELVMGQPINEAADALEAALSLSSSPEINVSPPWFPYVPFTPVKLDVEVVPGDLSLSSP